MIRGYSWVASDVSSGVNFLIKGIGVREWTWFSHSTLSADLQGLGNLNSTQHRKSYLAVWLWVCLSLWAVSTPITHCIVAVQESEPQPFPWVLAVWRSAGPVCAQKHSVVSGIFDSFATLVIFLYRTFSICLSWDSFPSRFHSRSAQLSRQIPAYSQEQELKWPGFHHCLKLNWLALPLSGPHKHLWFTWVSWYIWQN